MPLLIEFRIIGTNFLKLRDIVGALKLKIGAILMKFIFDFIFTNTIKMQTLLVVAVCFCSFKDLWTESTITSKMAKVGIPVQLFNIFSDVMTSKILACEMKSSIVLTWIAENKIKYNIEY